MDLLTSASSVPSAYWGDHWRWELGLCLSHGVLKGSGLSSSSPLGQHVQHHQRNRGSSLTSLGFLLFSPCPVGEESEQVLVGCQHKAAGMQQTLAAVYTLQI